MNATVIVIGGGYAGTLAADYLTSRPGTDVVLVNPRAEFVERIRLHQHAAGSGTAVREYGDLLAEGVRLVVGEVVRIDAPARRVHLANGDELAYDYLVYAVGSTGTAPEHAHSVATLEQAEKLRAALAESPDEPVTVVGGGLTGIETAAELAEQGRRVTLVGPLAHSLSARARRTIARRLERLGVTLVDERASGPRGFTVWTAGFATPALARDSGLTTDELGRLVTDDTLTSVDDDRIVATGDAAGVVGPPRMSCQAASQLGPQAARTVLARLAGDTPAAWDIGFVGSCVSMGRTAGVVQIARRDDTPRDLVIGGRMAAVIKELVCRGTVSSVRREARRPGSTPFLKGGRRDAGPVD